LSLWRSTLIYIFLAIPCIAYVLAISLQDSLIHKFLAISLIVLITGYLESFKLFYFPLLIFCLFLAVREKQLPKIFAFLQKNFSSTFLLIISFAVMYQFAFDRGGFNLLLFFGFTISFLYLTELAKKYCNRYTVLQKPWFLPLLFIALFDFAVLYQQEGPEIHFKGRVRGLIQPWVDMQLYAKKHSDKDDLFIIPPHLNDFSTYSHRAILGDWAEGANMLYLDNQFARDWFTRMNDLGWKWLHGSFEGYKNLSTDQVVKAAQKYGARFVITEKPKTFDLEKCYENKKFILYKSKGSHLNY